MNKFINISKQVIGILLLAFILFASLIISGQLLRSIGLYPRPNYEKMSKAFDKDCENLTVVADYLSAYEYDEIYIESKYMKKGLMSLGGGTPIPVENDNIIQLLKVLKRHSYQFIEKSDNTISFEKWSSFDCGIGVAYTTDGNAPNIQYLSYYESLSEPSWFYYEADYNQWRLNNNT